VVTTTIRLPLETHSTAIRRTAHSTTYITTISLMGVGAGGLARSDKVKDVGVWFDEKLNFRERMHEKITKTLLR